MDNTGKKLLNLLFNEGESICASNSEFAFHSMPLLSAFEDKVTLVSNNQSVPVSYCKSSDLTLCSINPISGYRQDRNVTHFRSFLVEIDIGTISQQLKTIEHLKMPFSAQVFSGNKSVHTAITLSSDILNEKIYRDTAEWIFRIVTLADQNCKNPSRSIRIPGAYRDVNKKQELISIGNRVTPTELQNWLNGYEHLRPTIRAKKEVIEGEADYSKLSNWARSMINNGILFKNGRNQGWFGLAYDFALAGYDEDEAIRILGTRYSEEYDFREKEWLAAIVSAFKCAREQ